MEPIFHLSIPVNDLARAKTFYIDVLGCKIGRETEGRFDINFFGHHIVAHFSPSDSELALGTIPSDGDTAPLRHFGVILPLDAWREMERKLLESNVQFVLSPRHSFIGTLAEQHIMMLADGCGNVIEFKSQPHERIFATAPP